MKNHLIEEYLREMTLTKSKCTAQQYRVRLERFASFVHKQKNGAHFTRSVAVEFIGWMKKEKFGEASISYHQMTMRGFYAWLALNGYIEKNFLETNIVPIYKAPKRPDNFVFTDEEYQKIKAECLRIQNGDYVFFHDACVIAWNTGLRMADVALMKKDQIDLAKRKLTVRPQKTTRIGKIVEIPITQELYNVLKDNTYTDYVLPMMALFYNTRGPSSISDYFSRILDRCGIEGKSFHCFRHRMATALLNAGTPISIVSSITGQTLSTIQRYSHAASFEETTKYMNQIAAA